MTLAIHCREAGVSLIELLISMAIGLIIMSAMVALYAATMHANRVSRAQAEMNEDAQYALKQITRQIQLAGYNPKDSAGIRNAMPSGFTLVGCKTGFRDPLAATGALKCKTGTLEDQAVSVSYEADQYNTIAIAGTAKPTSCLGEEVLPQPAGQVVAENRYYVKDGALRCTGLTDPAPPAGGARGNSADLINNVEKVEFLFGMAPATGTGNVAGYQGAEDLGLPDDPSSVSRWARVTTVQVCIVMVSKAPLFDDAVKSRDCRGDLGSADRHLRRAYVATAALRNRLAP